jgi:NADH dehydrogenase/putative oxidoreductase
MANPTAIPTSTRWTSPQSPVADALRRTAGLLHAVATGTWPVADLLVRIALAQSFFVSGVLKAGNWASALQLAREEYPVPWIDPLTAAYLGVSVELGASVLLTLGLATRGAALALLVLTLVIQHYYVALDLHLFWAALFGWYLVHGAGPLSLDAALARGLADSAVPLAGPATRATEWVGTRVAPVYDLALRLWLGLAMTAVALGVEVSGAWLPVRTLAALPAPLGLACAGLLALGLGSRLAALAIAGAALAAGMRGVPAEHLGWLALAAVPVALRGGGTLALDHHTPRLLARWAPGLGESDAATLASLPRVVVIGAGFGGLACARALRHAPVTVTLLDRHNYHLFQPLLYQVATAGLAPSDVAVPVRELFREQRSARVLLGTVVGVDRERREVRLAGGGRLAYDYLVLATGASHSYFGRDDWAPHAPGLKRIEDATEVRRRVLLAFERAEACEDPLERAALMTFLVVGGGPTGVELAGAIAELARFGMDQDFRRIDPRQARVVLVQSGPRVLPTFAESLSADAARALERLGVEVLTESRVTDIDAAGVLVNGERIAARTVLWAAGVVASPAAAWLSAPADRAGRVEVGPDLSVPGHPEVFAVGDTALTRAWRGQPVPGLAPAAKQGGEYVARVIRARVRGHLPPPPFVYRHQGSLATVGRKAAVVDFGRIRLSGAPAWWLWGLVHVFFLVGLRNRVSVAWDWFWAYLTFRSGTRLITHGPEEGAGAGSVAVARDRPAVGQARVA